MADRSKPAAVADPIEPVTHEEAQPQLPGGYGPVEALRAEIVEALRETAQWYANEQWASGFDRVADRLERKP